MIPGLGAPTGLVLRRPEAAHSSAMRSSMCEVCVTEHGGSGVALFVAPLAGAAGRKGNTAGKYLCADLACPLYVRGKRRPRMRLVKGEETLSLDERIHRMMINLTAFARYVAAG